jgi:RNA polymerase subunit RPABC4/transcription elongation factor Spt4
LIGNAIHLIIKRAILSYDEAACLEMLSVPDDMKHLINYDEKVVWVLHGSETVLVSDQRLIIRKSGGLGLKKTFVDYPYSDMVNIKLDRGLRRASVEILMRSGVQNIRIRNLTKSDAYELHRMLRQHVVRTSVGQTNLPVIIQNQEQPSHLEQTSERVCKKCGRKVGVDFALCPYCRYPLKIECPECGKKVDRKFQLCPYCGEDLSYAEEIDVEL